LPHIRRLNDIGFDANLPDEMGMPPLHLAGWEGLAEKFAYLPSLGPDMSQVIAYGGTVFSTILHDSEHCPKRAEMNHIGWMRIAPEHGVALPRPAISGAIAPEMAAILADWADARPGQVVEDGAWQIAKSSDRHA